MQNDLQIISAGLRAMTHRQEAIAGNLANVNTPGFRRQASFLHMFDTALDGTLVSDRVQFPDLTTGIDLTPGEARHTGNPLDLAIGGDGFFGIQTEDGTRFTRGGRFTRNAAGELATHAGDPVLGEGGPITLRGTGPVVVSEDGTVSVGDRPVGRIKLVDFEQPQNLIRGDGGLIEAPPEAVERTVDDPKISQGAIEGSNVDVTMEMVQLIEAQRSFERKSRALQMINEVQSILMRAAQGI
jgi:flagellar basal-body rod protein FlgF